MKLAEVMAIYRGSDGEATRELYRRLHARGVAGFVAVNVFRAVKCSERAKVYRGGGYRGAAYDRKQWSVENLAVALTAHAANLGISWGWREDPAQPYHRWVLYVELPDVGQVSFHAAERGSGPDFPGEWDEVRGAAPQRACVFAVRVLELAPPSTSAPPATTMAPGFPAT